MPPRPSEAKKYSTSPEPMDGFKAGYLFVQGLFRLIEALVAPGSSGVAGKFRQLFGASPLKREASDTRALYRKATKEHPRSPFASEEATKAFLHSTIVDICAEHGVYPSNALGSALWDSINQFLYTENMAMELCAMPERLTLEEGVLYRKILRQHLAFLADHEQMLPVVRRKLVALFSGILRYFPSSAFIDVDENGRSTENAVVFPEAKAFALCENLPEVIERSLRTFADADVEGAHIFETMRERFNQNVSRFGNSDDWPLPSERKHGDPERLVQEYLAGTPLYDFFDAKFPFAIPFPARFEHTHIVGGTGHGKTQLLQFLINHDLVKSQEDDRSVVIMDSQGDLIRTISRLQYFKPETYNILAERLVMIDPTDVEHPIALNMFDFNRDRLSGYAPLDREKILNATVELYEYFFGALLGAELTQRQGVIFRYIARLLMEIPGATIHTLRELMEDGEKFLPYMEKLTGTTRAFFATRFFEKQFNETKKQILVRLWGVLSNAAMERMFSHKHSAIDLFKLLNNGSIIFINTAKDLLGQEGTEIFGRFFIALILQAAVQRAAQKPHERNPTFVYIDEAADYFDANIGNLLNQTRKYRLGITFAHQNLDQLTPELRASVMSSTTIKFVGGVSAKDATALSHELRCEPDFLLAQKKRAKHTEFACYVKNYTGRPLSVSIPIGYVESLPTLSAEDQETLLERNRAVYSMTPESVPDVPFTIGKAETKKEQKEKKEDVPQPEPVPRAPLEKEARVEPPPGPPVVSSPARPLARPAPRVPPTPGRGGKDHKRIQHFVKGLAEHRGFRAVIEDTILEGKGQIDVSLVRGDLRIACEISITTGKDHELGNVEKCLAAGYKHILFIGKTERQAKTRAAFIEKNLEEGHGATIHAIAEDGIDNYLQSFGNVVNTTTSMVGGIPVTTETIAAPLEDAAKRYKTLVDIVARMKRPGAE